MPVLCLGEVPWWKKNRACPQGEGHQCQGTAGWGDVNKAQGLGTWSQGPSLEASWISLLTFYWLFHLECKLQESRGHTWLIHHHILAPTTTLTDRGGPWQVGWGCESMSKWMNDPEATQFYPISQKKGAFQRCSEDCGVEKDLNSWHGEQRGSYNSTALPRMIHGPKQPTHIPQGYCSLLIHLSLTKCRWAQEE